MPKRKCLISVADLEFFTTLHGLLLALLFVDSQTLTQSQNLSSHTSWLFDIIKKLETFHWVKIVVDVQYTTACHESCACSHFLSATPVIISNCVQNNLLLCIPQPNSILLHLMCYIMFYVLRIRQYKKLEWLPNYFSKHNPKGKSNITFHVQAPHISASHHCIC